MKNMKSLSELNEMSEQELHAHEMRCKDRAYQLLQNVAKEFDQIKLCYVAKGNYPMTEKTFEDARLLFLMHAQRL